MKKQTINIEPSWESLCIAVGRGALNAEVLLPACQLTDAVRQAQKSGANQVIITFTPGQRDFKLNVVD
jgi:hypothetical protein